MEACLTILDIDRLRGAALRRDPFDFVVVEGFLRRERIGQAIADFPKTPGHGSFPVEMLTKGPSFAALVGELTGAALRRAIEEKFGIDLSGRPTLLTVRGHSDGKDGRIHTDSDTKLITLLLYMNPSWEASAGRLRLLRGPDDLDDYAVEVAPLAGTMLAFRRSDRSFHGHRAAFRRTPCPAAELGNRPGGGSSRVEPASLVGADQGSEPVSSPGSPWADLGDRR